MLGPCIFLALNNPVTLAFFSLDAKVDTASVSDGSLDKAGVALCTMQLEPGSSCVVLKECKYAMPRSGMDRVVVVLKRHDAELHVKHEQTHAHRQINRAEGSVTIYGHNLGKAPQGWDR